jgi:hypothetical protein
MQSMTDTTPEIAEMVRARLMALSGAERFVMGTQMFDAARAMVLASFPPGLSDTECKRRLFERVYGESLPEPAIAEEALKKGMEEKSKKFVEKGAEVYSKA